LLFIKMQAAEYMLYKGSCLTTERKQRLENKLESPKRQGKKRK
jgi:hypothetical protein